MEESIVETLENNSDAIPEEVQGKLSKIFEKYEQLSDEEKKEFQQGAFDVLTKTLRKLRGNSILPTWLAPYQSYILFTFAVSVIGFLLVIIARRLYSRTWEREERQKEKRRLKQQKAEARQLKAMKKKKQKAT
ncbi:uncharacterized protein LOC114941670 [Nylanderia fulva]|uniref:uncharacterized protein LOC114941670 n=1 Tax=Nylanderia fulva TaxID=613905 RepID=UPI0010FB41C0|nr:uncharacterized protein LOC114941670 [Nylanderia fulva]